VDRRSCLGCWRVVRRGGFGLAMHEMVGRPGSGELHLAVFQLDRRGGVPILVALNVFMVDEVGDVEKHLAGAIAFAGDFFVEGGEHAVHLHGDGACPGLAFALLGGVFAEAGQILPADAVHQDGLVELAATVVDDDLEVHLGFAAEALEIGEELALVGADGAAEGLVIGIDGAETEREDGGHFEAVGDDLAVVDCGFLEEGLVGVVFADNYG